MRTLFILPILGLLLISCNTDNQNATLDKIAENYEASVSSSREFQMNDENNESYEAFKIKLTNSKMLDTLRPDLVSPSVAMMLLDGFTNEEKEEFGYIIVETVNSETGESTVYRYEPETLGPYLQKAKVFTEFSKNIVEENYEAVVKNVIEEYRKPTLGVELGNFMKALIDEHGKITDYKRTTLRLHTGSDGEELWVYDGVLNFDDGFKRPYHITTSTKVGEPYVSGYQLD
ncbi:hypothetical protein [Flagellimonas oceanensis]|uniref:hypothetical protein n=1 Tax=Flagellimonas oceanensis TaxID=2499163 RepID=UPI000F8EF189|nr:hypothetical protein [Allomuricauda oceanensis]|tara:strand:- start:19565 stop:20257 length:693 start_codon:yes stop_codon:yes gene_type:complete